MAIMFVQKGSRPRNPSAKSQKHDADRDCFSRCPKEYDVSGQREESKDIGLKQPRFMLQAGLFHPNMH